MNDSQFKVGELLALVESRSPSYRERPTTKRIQIPPKLHRKLLKILDLELLEGLLWGHGTDVEEYCKIDEEVIEKIRVMFYNGVIGKISPLFTSK